MKRVYVNITAYVMAAVIALTGILSLPFSVSAQTARDLYGTGSEEDIDIIKLLDMALNKGGMSMSPSTIKAFLEYWWDSVAADLNTCINNADSAVTTTTAFVDYLNSTLVDAEHYDDLGDIIKRYIQYVLTLDYKSLSDFKQLLTQEGTFRSFLLSYVTDEDGNIAGTVDNKVKRYSLKSGFVNMARSAAKSYIGEYEGYYLVPTYTKSVLSTAYFASKSLYDNCMASLGTLSDDQIVFLRSGTGNYFMNLTDVVLIGTIESYSNSSGSYPYFRKLYTYESDWNPVKTYYVSFSYDSVDLSIDGAFDRQSAVTFVEQVFLRPDVFSFVNCLFTTDGRTIKVWKSLDSYKAYSVGKNNIYYSDGYSSYDDSKDNGIIFTGDYYMNSDYSHTTIQNTIDNSQDITENTVNNITNNYITNNNYGVGGNGDGTGSGGNGGSGNWFADLITGIPQLLAALVDGIAGLLEAGGRLIETIVELFIKLFVPSEGFADPIKNKVEEKFSFVDDLHVGMSGILERFSSMGKTAPTITVPLSKTPLADYGVEDVVMTFDWFEPYRMGFHLLLSAIMWAMFLFNQFFGIKNLIQGTGSVTSNVDGGEPEHNPIGFLW